MKKKAAKTIPLVNNKGQIIRVPAKWTLDDLVRAGFTAFGVVRPEVPMKEGEFRSVAPEDKV